mgnify:FL=1
MTLLSNAAAVGFIISLWFGCYLASRRPAAATERLAVLLMLSLAGWLLHNVLCLHVPAVEAGFLWRRALGWLFIPALAFWYHLTCLFVSEPVPVLSWLRRSIYVWAFLLAGTWVFVPWTFVRMSLFPLELTHPVAGYSLVTGFLGLANLTWAASRPTRGSQFARTTLLLSALALFGGLLWPLAASLLGLPLGPGDIWGLGQLLITAAVAGLGYSFVGRAQAQTGIDLGRDLAHKFITTVTIVALYLIAVVALFSITKQLGFDPLPLTLVGVAALAVITHLLHDLTYGLWDRIFFKRWAHLTTQMRWLAREIPLRPSSAELLKPILQEIREVLDTEWVALATGNADRMVVLAATDPKLVGKPAEELLAQGTVWAEPVVGRQGQVGLLVVGLRQSLPRDFTGVGRLRVIAGQVADLLAITARQELATSHLSRFTQEIRNQQHLGAEVRQQILAGIEELRLVRCEADLHLLRQLVHAFSSADRLQRLLLDDSAGVDGETRSAQVRRIRELLEKAVESLKPATPLPPIENLRGRSLAQKRLRRLPVAVADYYTLKLIMDGYTHEAVAELLGVSPRQVRNYLERALRRLQANLASVLDENFR